MYGIAYIWIIFYVPAINILKLSYIAFQLAEPTPQNIWPSAGSFLRTKEGRGGVRPVPRFVGLFVLKKCTQGPLTNEILPHKYQFTPQQIPFARFVTTMILGAAVNVRLP